MILPLLGKPSRICAVIVGYTYHSIRILSNRYIKLYCLINYNIGIPQHVLRVLLWNYFSVQKLQETFKKSLKILIASLLILIEFHMRFKFCFGEIRYNQNYVGFFVYLGLMVTLGLQFGASCLAIAAELAQIAQKIKMAF